MSFLQKLLIISLLVIAVFLPWMEFPKHFSSILFVSIALYLQLKNKTWRQYDRLDYLLWLWIFSGFIIASFAPIHYKEWKGAAVSMFMPLMMLTLRYTDLTDKKILWVLKGVLLGTLIATLEGFWQIAAEHHDSLRLHSVGHVNQSAIYLCLNFSITLALCLTISKKPAYKVYALSGYLLFLVFSILYSDSRGSAITMLVIGLSMPLFWIKKSKKPFVITIVTLLLISSTLFYSNAPIIKKTLKQTTKGKILSERQKIWNSARLIWQHNPVFGIGIKNYPKAKKKMQRRWLKQDGHKYSSKKYLPYAHGHSLFFNTLAEQGIFGVSIIFFVLLSIIWRLKTHFPTTESSHIYWLLCLSSLGAILVVILNGLVNTTLKVEHGLLFAIIIGLWLGFVRSGSADQLGKQLHNLNRA